MYWTLVLKEQIRKNKVYFFWQLKSNIIAFIVIVTVQCLWTCYSHRMYILNFNVKIYLSFVGWKRILGLYINWILWNIIWVKYHFNSRDILEISDQSMYFQIPWKFNVYSTHEITLLIIYLVLKQRPLESFRYPIKSEDKTAFFIKGNKGTVLSKKYLTNSH